MKCEIYLKEIKQPKKIPPKQELKILSKNNAEIGGSLIGNTDGHTGETILYNYMYTHQLFYFT